MPYYVYLIDTDSEYNQLIDVFDDFHDARKCEGEMKAGLIPGDNFSFHLICADDAIQAKLKLAKLRREMNLP